MFQDDFIMRQLSRFVLALAEQVGGQQTEDVDDLQDGIFAQRAPAVGRGHDLCAFGSGLLGAPRIGGRLIHAIQ